MGKKKPPKPKPTPKPEPKYTWSMNPEGVFCWKHESGGQTILRLWEAEELSPFHDEVLAKATRQINSILDKVAASPPSKDLEPSFIEFRNQLFMVWAKNKNDTISPYDDDKTIAKALGLRLREGDTS